jgi:isopenicillin-N epimerase
MEFDYTGTMDITAPLCVPAALRFMASIAPWREIMARNRALALEGRAILGIKPPAPDSMIGSLVSLPLPDAPAPPSTRLHSTAPLQDELLERFGIEVPVFPWPAPPKRILRISAQVYNEAAEYRKLADALAALNVR